jgi:hypothetical protein
MLWAIVFTSNFISRTVPVRLMLLWRKIENAYDYVLAVAERAV